MLGIQQTKVLTSNVASLKIPVSPGSKYGMEVRAVSKVDEFEAKSNSSNSIIVTVQPG